MPKLSETAWFPVLCSLVITIGAFGGMTFYLVGKLTANQAHGDSHAAAAPPAHAAAAAPPAHATAAPPAHGDSHGNSDTAAPAHGNSDTAAPAHGDSDTAAPAHGDSHGNSDTAAPAHGDSHDTNNNPGHLDWGYEGKVGPDNWSQFAPIAGSGIRQSPINLITEKTVTPVNLTPVGFHYQDSVFSLSNNGHTIQANCDPDNSVLIDGHHYTLLQFHFHARSEHLIDGKDYPMEVHLVHVISDKHEELPPAVEATKPPPKSKAVIGVMIKEGKANSFIGNLWKKIPDPDSPPVHYFITGQNANALLPESGKRSFYRYNGSLTTPPCTENVLWTVMTEPIEFSKEQIESFTKLYSNNNRPPQNPHQRFVLSYHDSGDNIPLRPSSPISAPQGPSRPEVPPAQPFIPALPKGGVGIHPSPINLQLTPLSPAKIAPIIPDPRKLGLTIND